jgi:hypothetical protein
MAGFFTRTKHLDKHVAHRLRVRGHAFARNDDMDSPLFYELAKMFARSADTESIKDWIRDQDTAFREIVPETVYDIIKDNTYE